MPEEVLETAIYTRNDGIVDWHFCLTGLEGCDFEVPGTHIGLSFNASAYAVIANRLADRYYAQSLTLKVERAPPLARCA